MLYDLYKRLTAERWFKPAAFIVLFLIIVLIIVGISIMFAPHKSYELKNTHLNTSTSRVDVDGTTLFSYSSDSFTAYDLQENTPPDILLTGIKLPDLKDITWANKQGAIITLQNTDESSLFGTAIQAYIDRNTANTNQLRNTTMWYIDFSNGSLTPVSPNGVIFDNSIVYSESEKGFYLIANPSAASRINNDVIFFSTETKQLSNRGTMKNYNSISSASLCMNNSALCVVGYKIESPKSIQLSSFTFNSKSEKSYIKATGIIEKTNVDNIFAVFNDSSNNSSDNEADDFTFKEINFFDVSQDKSDSTIAIPETNQASSILIDPENTETKIIIGVNNSYNTYRSEVRTFLGFMTKRDVTIANADDTQLTDVISSSGNSNTAIVADSNGNYRLITPSSTKQQFDIESDDKVSQALTACESKVGAFNDFEVSESEIKVMTLGTLNDYTKSFREIGDCLKQSPNIFTGRAVTYYGLSERSARIVVQ